jgi:hypothetical protein
MTEFLTQTALGIPVVIVNSLTIYTAARVLRRPLRRWRRRHRRC